MPAEQVKLLPGGVEQHVQLGARHSLEGGVIEDVDVRRHLPEALHRLQLQLLQVLVLVGLGPLQDHYDARTDGVVRHQHDEEEDVGEAAPRPALHLVEHGQREALAEAEAALGRLEGAVLDILHAALQVGGDLRLVHAGEHGRHRQPPGVRLRLLLRRRSRLRVLPARRCSRCRRRPHVQLRRPGPDRSGI